MCKEKVKLERMHVYRTKTNHVSTAFIGSHILWPSGMSILSYLVLYCP